MRPLCPVDASSFYFHFFKRWSRVLLLPIAFVLFFWVAVWVSSGWAIATELELAKPEPETDAAESGAEPEGQTEPEQALEAPQVPVFRSMVVETRMPSGQLLGTSRLKVKGDRLFVGANQFLGDVASRLPGVFVTRSGTAGVNEGYYIRGGEPSGVLMEIDGVRWSNIYRGIPFANLVPLQDVESVEILIGPAGPSWGQRAAEGVIRLSTVGEPATDGASGRVYGGIGAFGAMNAGGSAGYRFGEHGWGRGSINFFSIQGRDGVNEGGEQVSGSLRGGVNLGRAASLDLSLISVNLDKELFYVDAGPEPGSGAAVSLIREDNRAMEADMRAISLLLHGELAPAWDYGLRFTARSGFLRDHNSVSPFESGPHPERGIFLESIYDVDDGEWALENFHRFGHRFGAVASSLNVAIDFRKEWFQMGSIEQPDYYLPVVENSMDGGRQTVGLQVREDLKIPWGLSLDVGGRVENADDYGTVLTSRVGVMWRAPRFEVAGLAQESAVAFSRAEGYRPPGYMLVLHPVYGNPDLKPEESAAMEAVLEHNFANGLAVASITGFKTDYTNLIVRMPSMAQNTGTAQTRGLEGRLALRPLRWLKLAVFGTELRAEDGHGNPLPDRPESRWGAELAASNERFGVSLLATHVGERLYPVPMQGIDGRVVTGFEPFTTLDLRVMVAAGESWGPLSGSRIDLLIRNLTNQQYQTIPGLDEPGVTACLSLSSQFSSPN